MILATQGQDKKKRINKVSHIMMCLVLCPTPFKTESPDGSIDTKCSNYSKRIHSINKDNKETTQEQMKMEVRIM